jgi:hypothetical protein
VQAPLETVGGTGACLKNGVSTGISGQHQRLTATPDHTALSFEEFGLQYYKDNFNKQKGLCTSKDIAFCI